MSVIREIKDMPGVVIGFLLLLYLMISNVFLAFHQPELTSTQRLLCLPEALTWQHCEGARGDK